jgi:transketolase
MLAEPGCVCLAMGRSKMLPVLGEDGEPFYAGKYEFKYGAIDQLRGGTDVVLFAMGHLASRALEARELLAKEGVSAKVLHCASPLGMNAEELFGLIGKLPVVTCEDHHADTGLGSIVALMAARAGRAVKLATMGVTHYGMSGSNKDVLAEMKLTPEGIAAKARELLA